MSQIRSPMAEKVTGISTQTFYDPVIFSAIIWQTKNYGK